MCVPVIFTTPVQESCGSACSTLSPPFAAVPVAAANSMQILTSVSAMTVSLLDSYSFSHQLTITLEDGNTPPRASKGIRWCSIGHIPHVALAGQAVCVYSRSCLILNRQPKSRVEQVFNTCASARLQPCSFATESTSRTSCRFPFLPPPPRNDAEGCIRRLLAALVQPSPQ